MLSDAGGRSAGGIRVLGGDTEPDTPVRVRLYLRTYSSGRRAVSCVMHQTLIRASGVLKCF